MRDIIAPALATGLVEGGGLILEAVGDFGGGGGDLMRAVEVDLEGGEGEGGMIEVGVENELVVRVRVAVTVFALDGAVAGANVGLQHIADHLAHVFNLGELRRAPVV